MHKEFKQWKKIFADKYFLIAFTLFCYAAVTCVANFLLHLFKQIPLMLSSFKTFDQSKISSPFDSYSWKWFFEFEWDMGIIYGVLYIIASIFIVRQVYRFRIAFRDINKQTKGTARWTTIKEIQETYKAIKDDDIEYEGSAGMPIVHFNDHLYVDTNSTHTLVVASTQSGKTETYSYPYLDVIMRAKKRTLL